MRYPWTVRRFSVGQSTRVMWVLAVLAVVQTAAGVGVALVRSSGDSRAPQPAVSASTSVAGPGDSTFVATEAPAPLRLEVPSVGIVTSLVRLHVDADGALGAPGEFGVAGWWAEGPKPGDAGPAVLVGHVDSYTGPAVFYRLRDAKPGATVKVIRSDGSAVEFAVDGLRQYPKDELPTEEVYGPTTSSTLRLITCGGRFDRRKGEYTDNIVVFAHLVTLGA